MKRKRGESDILNEKCWRKRGCIFNSNFPSYMKCWREDYSVEKCKEDNKEQWNKIDKLKKGDNKMILTDSEKLALINTMEFIESDGDGECCYYVLVEDNKENRDILYKVGLTNEDIETYCNPEEDTLDISPIAFRYANWYGGKEKGFYNKPELDIKSMAVVNRGDLVDYLMTCKEDCWTRSGWDKLFEELETNLTYASK